MPEVIRDSGLGTANPRTRPLGLDTREYLRRPDDDQEGMARSLAELRFYGGLGWIQRPPASLP